MRVCDHSRIAPEELVGEERKNLFFLDWDFHEQASTFPEPNWSFKPICFLMGYCYRLFWDLLVLHILRKSQQHMYCVSWDLGDNISNHQMVPLKLFSLGLRRIWVLLPSPSTWRNLDAQTAYRFLSIPLLIYRPFLDLSSFFKMWRLVVS